MRVHSALVCCLLLLLAAPGSEGKGKKGAKAQPKQDYYSILEVDHDADDRTLKKAYRAQALKWHPDKVSEDKKEEATERFAQISAAYEVLSDNEKRQIYDQYGEDGLKEGGPGGPGGAHFHTAGDPFEMFASFFGDMGGMGGGSGGQRVKVTMEGGDGIDLGDMGIDLGDIFGGAFGGGGFEGFDMGGGMGGGRGGGRGGQQAQAESLYEDDPNVIDITSSDFPPSDKDRVVYLIEFYSPGCGHCVQFSPKFKQVAASVHGNVKVGAVNCDKESSLCSQYGVKGYPTFKAFVPSQSSPKEYKGDRTAKALIDWALSLIPSSVHKLKSQKDLDALLAICREGKQARSALCAVLITDKPTTSSLYKALSTLYSGKVAFGEVQASSSVVSSLGGKPDSLPSLLLICNGDLELAERYQGAMKFDSLNARLTTYEGGRKCASAVRLDPSTDFSALKASVLKTIVKEKGIECVGCSEKGDFIKAIRGYIEQTKGSGSDEL